MPIIKILLLALSLLIFFYLIFPFITVIISLLAKEKKVKNSEEEIDLACIITAYKNATIAMPLIDSLLKQDYHKFSIYLVADDCDISNITINDERLAVLKPAQKLGSKVLSIKHAIEHFNQQHEAVVIFDPDNLAKQGLLRILNNYLAAGYVAVQGKRTAKNLDTIYACADATGEIYKNYVERYAPFLLGSSPTIAGSGMAVELNIFKQYLNGPVISESLNQGKVIAAEDKILQNHLVNAGHQIAFAKDAIIYDEKVTEAHQVERQRSRWLFSYFENFQNAVGFLFSGIIKLDINRLIFGLTTSVPPLFILLLSAVIVGLIVVPISVPLALIMLVGLIIFTANILFTLALSNAPSEIWKALWGIPFFVFKQFLGLLKMGRSKKDFMHTEHKRNISIDEINKG